MQVNAKQAKPKSDKALFYIRQPIYDQSMSIWGYDLQAKEIHAGTALQMPPEDAGSLQEARDRRNVLRRILDRGARAVLPVQERFLLQAVSFIAPPVQIGFRISASKPLSAAGLKEIERLKEEGHVILAEVSSEEADGGLLQVSDIICLDVAGLSPDEVRRRIKGWELFDATLMARGVADKSHLDEYRDMGFSLFTGAFFKTPEIIPGKVLSPHRASRLQIFQVMEQRDPNFADLANAIQADVSLSLRLLAYLNSAIFSMPVKITSIKQAITLLGWKKVRTWLRMVLLTDMLADDEDSELLFVSLQRGKFLELVTTQHPELHFDPGEMFLLGAFSLLETILGVPMKQILAELPLDERLKGTLCRRKTEYLPLLQLAELFEEPDWTELENLLQLLRLDFDKVALAVFTSSIWVEQFFETQEGLRH
ncbi:HDOD domain-containing protein [Desulfocurvibacter africanus]|uniref:Diguanylate phosphodiesterase metal dependent hydrolase domain-containing protein n=1 Tax=Desulfocurvibacter africanus subsp. africanus str. Walvis Bay TaxID=690850 RepID=F3Z0R3_DESAF|nr:HDOD domain-containing protein [Desulfocurvibacter africanus]EGJ49887.1 diguanylate phosphodiesterase metal dependent hydrolase domain-containing protein [Desulfocurvibacter africanus subsp. africanus str. Walvis Bay]